MISKLEMENYRTKEQKNGKQKRNEKNRNCEWQTEAK